MDTIQEKFRIERGAREKARLEKLRKLNMQKYKKDNFLPLPKASKRILTTTSQIPPKLNSQPPTLPKPPTKPDDITKKSDHKVPPRVSVAGLSKVDPKTHTKKTTSAGPSNLIKTVNVTRKSVLPQKITSAPSRIIPEVSKKHSVPPPKVTQEQPANSGPMSFRKSMAPYNLTRKSILPTKTAPNPIRKSVAPTKIDSKESVFDRLYKPKIVASKPSSTIAKLENEIKYRGNVNSIVNRNKRHTVFEPKPTVRPPVRRSISAVHFKRISKSELANCVHKWASSENLNKHNLKNIEEEAAVLQDQVVSAIKSERKRVQFKTSFSNLNTPRPEELQSRLKSWLQKRGKSLSSYHHLQCFGLHHQAQIAKEFQPYAEEDKENIAVESDSDNDSYCEATSEKCVSDNKWRRASCVSGFDDTQDTIESHELQNGDENSDEVHNSVDLYLGALSDLTELVKEGYEWDQSARWLHVIRSRCPAVTSSAGYWECRAMLAERRGDFPSTLDCWEEALVNGSKSSVVEANLDQLLTKFMQLKISPNSVKKKPMTPRMLDVKNICKSSLLRFAVQEAKTRLSNQQVQYIVTPVRRSNRTTRNSSSKRPPLVQISAIKSLGKDAQFVANRTLPLTP